MARRGAPFGNRNAVKHGLFVRDPNAIPPNSLENANHLEIEIAVLRVYILRLLALTSKSSDVKLIMSALHGFTLAAARLNSLIKTRHYLNLNQGRIPEEYLELLFNLYKLSNPNAAEVEKPDMPPASEEDPDDPAAA